MALVTWASSLALYPDEPETMTTYDQPEVVTQRDGDIVRIDVNCVQGDRPYPLGKPGVGLTLSRDEARALAGSILAATLDLQVVRDAISTALDALDLADEETDRLYGAEPDTRKSNRAATDRNRRRFLSLLRGI